MGASVSNVAAEGTCSPCGKHMGAGTAARFDSVKLTKLAVQRHKVVGAGTLAALALDVSKITYQAAKQAGIAPHDLVS